MSGAESALEGAVLAVLGADAGVRAVLGNPLRVLGASLKPAYPYLEIVRHESVSADAAGVEASEHRLDLAIIARDGPDGDAKAGLSAVRAALRDVAPEMEGFRCVLLAPVFADVVRTRFNGGRGMLRLRAVVEVG